MRERIPWEVPPAVELSGPISTMVICSLVSRDWTSKAKDPLGCCQDFKMRHFWAGLPASWTVMRSRPLFFGGWAGAGACPQARPAQVNVSTRALFHLAETMAGPPFLFSPLAYSFQKSSHFFLFFVLVRA